MNQKTCPMCQGGLFLVRTDYAYENPIMLGAFKGIPVFASICLSCGFISPTLDEAGLKKINKLAAESGQAGDERPDAEEFQEL